jgi:hypothetical protein
LLNFFIELKIIALYNYLEELIAMKRIKKSGQACVTGQNVKRYGSPLNIKADEEKPKEMETLNVPSDR